MNLISVQSISKTLDSKPLFNNLSFGVDAGDRLGIIGRNGTGKSTLLKTLVGIMAPDEGRISINKDAELAYLEQQTAFEDGWTPLQFLYSLSSRRIDTAKRLTTEPLTTQLEAQANLLDAWTLETDFRLYLLHLGMECDLDKKLSSLSGGEVKKLALARILATRASVLLLDEPTNHLDLMASAKLEKELTSTKTTLLLISHDRYLLDRICSRTLEIEGEQTHLYDGGYGRYVQEKAQRLADLQKQTDRLKTILRREGEWLLRGPQARATKDSGRKLRIEEMKEEKAQADAILLDQTKQKTSLSSLTQRLGKKILEIKNISKSYDGRPLIKDFSYTFAKSDRFGIIGPNGCGKTTLLKMITGSLEPDSGAIETGVNTVFGYYEQTSEKMDSSKTALEYIEDISEHIQLEPGYIVSASKFLEIFDFDSELQRKPIGTYSGGERRRLHLISTLVSNPNFLVFDECTNDLDIATIRTLEDYIESFSGCVVLVSHDRAFMDRVCSELFCFQEDGRIVRYEGTCSEYLEELTRQQQPRQEAPKEAPAPQKAKKGLSYKEQKRFEQVEETIAEKEDEKAEIEAFFSSGSIDSDGSKSRQYKEVCDLLESLYAEWEELGSRA